MRRRQIEHFAQLYALGVEAIRHRAHGRLRALVMDVPALEVLEWRGIHEDERRMDDRPGVHQRPGKCVAAGLDRRISLLQHRNGARRFPRRIDTRGQPHRAHRDRHFRRAALSREIGQRSRLGPHDPALRGSASHCIAAEGSRRHEHDLAVFEMRRDGARDVELRRCRAGHEDELGAAHRIAGACKERVDLHRPGSAFIGKREAARGEQRRKGGGIAPPQPHLVTLFGEIRSRGIRTVAAAEHGNLHGRRRPSASGFTTLIGLPAVYALICSKMSENWISYSSRVT